jgi:hypothetical protein
MMTVLLASPSNDQKYDLTNRKITGAEANTYTGVYYQ